MKQHYKVWVYDNQGGATVESKDYSIAVSEKENVIVLTIEELRECFEWGIASFEDTQPVAMSFEDFLNHKGINI